MNNERNFSVVKWRDRMVERQRPNLRFETDYPAWRKAFAQEFKKLLGPFPEPVPLRAEIVERKVFAAYVREKVVFDSELFMSVPAWVCSPKGIPEGGRCPAVLCCHGHGHGKDSLVGVLANGMPGIDYHKRLAVELAERGYVAIAPDWRCFGERREQAEGDWCNLAHLAAELLGYNLLSLNVWDGMKALDYLETRGDVDPARIGCVGCSFGGTMSLFLSAADPRVSAVCVSGYLMATGKHPLSGNCGSQTLPGLLRWGDRAEAAGLICPRPLLIQVGEYDSSFPARHALEEHGRLRSIYEAAGEPAKLGLDLFDGCHEIHVAPILAWFDQWLNKVQKG